MSENVEQIEKTAKKAVKQSNKDKSPVSQQIESARQKFIEVAKGAEEKVRDIGKSADKASAAAQEKYTVAAEKVRTGYDKARKDMDHLVDDVNEYVRDNPGRSVLIAAGIGFFLGLVMRGRRD